MESGSNYAREVSEAKREVSQRLNALLLRVVEENQKLNPSPRVTEHLVHGAGRRMRMVRRALENIFTLFPPDSQKPLPLDTVLDVQINLHALLVNAYAANDNWAWAFVLRHDLLQSIPTKMGVGLFNVQTTKFLPDALRQYLLSEGLTQWHREYAKRFRDATAHRIPPYIPPFVLLASDQKRHDELLVEKQRANEAGEFARLREVDAEIVRLYHPSLMFFNSLGPDEPTAGIYLHAQTVSDAMSLAEIGEKFLDNWHTCENRATEP